MRQRERSHNGGTISLDRIDHQLREKPAGPADAATLRDLYQCGMTLLLAPDTLPCKAPWPALAQVGIDHLFRAALLSCPLGVRKPQPLYYALVRAVTGCPAWHVLFADGNLGCDVAAPVTCGMRPGEELPDGALLIRHVSELPALLEPA